MKQKSITSFKDLQVWQKGMDLTEKMYQITKTFPREEVYGLASQLQRCAVSIPSNIAEGFTRRSGKEYIRFISIAFGSCAELETQIELAMRIGYLNEETFKEVMERVTELAKMLNGLIQSLKKSQL